METRFEAAFLKVVKKHASIKKLVKKKVDMIIENPIAIGELLKGNWQGFYSCPVKRNFIIIYLYCEVCRKKGDNGVVACSDCFACNADFFSFKLQPFPFTSIAGVCNGQMFIPGVRRSLHYACFTPHSDRRLDVCLPV